MRHKHDNHKGKHRCIFKKIAGGKACACGCYGKKLIHLPEPYKENEKVKRTVKKWRKKRAIQKAWKAKHSDDI